MYGRILSGRSTFLLTPLSPHEYVWLRVEWPSGRVCRYVVSELVRYLVRDQLSVALRHSDIPKTSNECDEALRAP